jgi:hypothetical protein
VSWFRRRPKHDLSFGVKTGGVERLIDPDFDEDEALQRELWRGYIRLGEQLRARGLIHVSEKLKAGDYTTQWITAEF